KGPGCHIQFAAASCRGEFLGQDRFGGPALRRLVLRMSRSAAEESKSKRQSCPCHDSIHRFPPLSGPRGKTLLRLANSLWGAGKVAGPPFNACRVGLRDYKVSKNVSIACRKFSYTIAGRLGWLSDDQI